MSMFRGTRPQQQAILNDKYAAAAHLIPGVPRYVVAGVSSPNFAFCQTNRLKVYTSIDAAFADCVDGQGDAIVLMDPAQNYTLTTTAAGGLAINKAGVSIWGYEAWFGLKTKKPSCSITPAAATQGLTITKNDFQIIGVTLIPITGLNFSTFSAAAARLRLRDCYLDLLTPAVNVATQGVIQTGAAPDIHISGCTIVSGGAQGIGFDLTGCVRFLVEDLDCIITAGTWASGVIKTGAATSGTVRRVSSTGLGVAINPVLKGTGTEGAGALLVGDCRVGVGHTLGAGYGLGNAITWLDQNFIATISGGTGGTLITTTT